MPDKFSLRNRDLQRVQRGLKVLSSGVTDAGGLRKFDFDLKTYWTIVENAAEAEKAQELYGKAESGLFDLYELTPGEPITAENRAKAIELNKAKEGLGDQITGEVFKPLDARLLLEKNQKFKVPPDTMADLWPILNPESIPAE